jgi:hypothetical protein
MKSQMLRIIAGFAATLCVSQIGHAGAYVAVRCANASLFDLKPGTSTFLFRYTSAVGDQIELENPNLGIDKQVDAIDHDLVVLSLKDSLGNIPKALITRKSGEISSAEIRKIKLVNKGIDTLANSRKVDLVFEIGSSSYSTFVAVDCELSGGRVNPLEPNSWFNAFKKEN